MELRDFLCEAFPKQMPKDKRYIDMRDPDHKSEWFIRAHVFLTADHRAVIFNYGKQGNKIEWVDLLQNYLSNPAPYQPGKFGIVPYRNGYIIDQTRDNATKWSAHINRYSLDLKEIVQGLIDLGLATGSTPFWIGNWAKAKPDRSMGSGNRILAQKENPGRLTLYHGTSNWRWQFIQEHGLSPIDSNDRVWNKEKDHSGHRDTSVYLTASLSQAEYYATKATNVDKRRLNNTIQMKAFQQVHYNPDAPEMTKRIAQWYHEGQKFKPVILQVSIPKSQYINLKADDDFLRTLAGREASSTDWEESLRHFGQVAFEGDIPPNRIKLFSND